MGYELPKNVEINGKSFAIRYDFRVILEIFEALNDAELDDRERAYAALQMFYVDFDQIEDFEKALEALFVFINHGERENAHKKSPKLVDWERDFQYIIAPVNKTLGFESRSVDYDNCSNTGGVHWWTFLSAYMEIGDCFFAQIIRIREKKAKGKPLDKSDREFYYKNRDIIDIKTRYTTEDKNLLKIWTELRK